MKTAGSGQYNPGEPFRSIGSFLFKNKELFSLFAAAYALVVASHRRITPELFWDAHVYAHAIDSYRSGSDPYQLGPTGLPFIYPPIFLLIGGWFEGFLDLRLGWDIYIAATVAATFCLPFLIARYFSYCRWLSYPVAIAIFLSGPQLAGATTVFTGNISSFCYLLIVAAATPGIKGRRWSYLYLAVCIASVIKISFLVLLILPLFVGEGQLLSCIATAVSTGLIYIAQMRLFADLYYRFRSSVVSQTFGHHTEGSSVFGAVSHLDARLHFTGYLVPTLCHVGYCVAGVIMLSVAKARYKPRSTNCTWLSVVLVFAVTCNPRMINYDSVIAMIPATTLVVGGLIDPRYRILTFMLSCCSLIAVFLGTGATGIMLWLIAGLIIGFLQIGRSTPLLGGSGS